MGQMFKFNILTGTDAADKYAAIPTKDPFTFYLLQTGVGYLGNTLLFDAGTAKNVLEEIGQETATNDTLATTKAIVDFVSKKVADITIGDVLTAKFFRNVEAYTLTAADMTNPAVSKPSGCKAGDIGLLFTADINENDDGDEQYYFVSLVDYLDSWYEFIDTNSVVFRVDNNRKVKAEVQVDSDYLEINSYGIAVKATAAIDPEKTTGKLVNDDAVLNFLNTYVIPRIEKLEETTAAHTTTLNEEVVKFATE